MDQVRTEIARELFEKFKKEHQGKWSPTLNDYLERGRVLWEDEGFCEFPTVPVKATGYVPLMKVNHLRHIPKGDVVYVKDDFSHPLFNKRIMNLRNLLKDYPKPTPSTAPMFPPNYVHSRQVRDIVSEAWNGGSELKKTTTVVSSCTWIEAEDVKTFLFFPLSSKNEIIVRKSLKPISGTIAWRRSYAFNRLREANKPSWLGVCGKQIYHEFMKLDAKKRKRGFPPNNNYFPSAYEYMGELCKKQPIQFWLPTPTYANFNHPQPKSPYFIHQANVQFFTTNFPVNVFWFQIFVSPSTLHHIAASVRNGWGTYKGHFEWLKNNKLIDKVPQECYEQCRQKTIK